MFGKLDTIPFPRACDTCLSAACHVYCPADSAFLCPSCDASVHVASRHVRVRVCDSCARAPAAFLCNADAASLCASCDAEIHSANPLATRHQRVPVPPVGVDDDDVAEAASWLVLNSEKNESDDGLLLLGGNVEECLDSCGETENGLCEVGFDDCSVPHHKNYEVDNSVVSIQNMQHEQVLEVEFDSSKPAFGSLSQSVSISSMDVNSVPESTISEVSTGTTLDLSSEPSILMSSYLTYRESRVIRYREKKKKRKFEKKIRYASRKAYAEIRPRIKGRFAKRNNNVEAEMDHTFSSNLITETGYSIVPSF